MKLIDPDSWSYKLGEKVGGILVLILLVAGVVFAIWKMVEAL